MRNTTSPLTFALIAAVTFALSTLILLLINLGHGRELEQVRADNLRLTQRTEHLRSALARFDEDQDDVVTVIEELEAELAEMRRNYANLGDTAEQVRQRLESANDRLNRFENLEGELQRVTRANEELQERNDILVERLEASRAELERRQQQYDDQSNPTVELY